MISCPLADATANSHNGGDEAVRNERGLAMRDGYGRGRTVRNECGLAMRDGYGRGRTVRNECGLAMRDGYGRGRTVRNECGLAMRDGYRRGGAVRNEYTLIVRDWQGYSLGGEGRSHDDRIPGGVVDGASDWEYAYKSQDQQPNKEDRFFVHR